MNPKLEKTLTVSTLFHLYQNLLTAKQTQYLELYVDEDWSLQEIAKSFHVSRTAVYDAIKKTITTLENLETKLGLNRKAQHLQKLINEHQHSDSEEVQTILKAIAMEV